MQRFNASAALLARRGGGSDLTAAQRDALTFAWLPGEAAPQLLSRFGLGPGQAPLARHALLVVDASLRKHWSEATLSEFEDLESWLEGVLTGVFPAYRRVVAAPESAYDRLTKVVHGQARRWWRSAGEFFDWSWLSDLLSTRARTMGVAEGIAIGVAVALVVGGAVAAVILLWDWSSDRPLPAPRRPQPPVGRSPVAAAADAVDSGEDSGGVSDGDAVLASAPDRNKPAPTTPASSREAATRAAAYGFAPGEVAHGSTGGERVQHV